MKPDDTHALIRAARRAIKSGSFESAESIAASILAECPAHLDALEIKALVATQRGDDRSAECILRTAIAAAPKRRWPYADLIRLLTRVGRNSDAEQVARAALLANPQNADAPAMLGSLLADREQWFEAAGHFERAIALAGQHPDLMTGLGRALLRLGRLDAAQPLLESAAAADPNALEPLVYLGELEERLGRFESAMRRLDRAEPIARRQGTDVDLQRSVLLARMDDHERALELLESKTGLGGAALLQRGRLRERLGRYAEAWSDWERGKAQLAERSQRQYAADAVRSQADRLAAFFNSPAGKGLPRASRLAGIPQPIFIIGFPRSGTTLTERILASHTSICAGGELPFGGELHDAAVSLAGGGDAFPSGLARCQDDWATALRDLYLAGAEKHGLLSSGCGYFTDKMPDNAFWLPLLRHAFPESAVVFVGRHPLDILTSVMAHDMTHGFNCGYRLGDAARHLALLDRLMESYRKAGFGPTYELRYEALVADQTGETERLTPAVGLEMEPGQLRFHESTAVPTTPSYAQVSEPLNDRSIGRWQNYAAQLGTIHPIVADVMTRGGYAP